MGKKKTSRASDNIPEEEEDVSQSSTNEKSLYEVCVNLFRSPLFHMIQFFYGRTSEISLLAGRCLGFFFNVLFLILGFWMIIFLDLFFFSFYFLKLLS